MHRFLLIAAFSFAPIASADDPGQRPRPAPSDRYGLLAINDQYYDLSANTGGDFYFWAPGEFANAGLQLPIHDEGVLLSYGRLDGPARSFTIPVESGARALTIFSGIQRKDLVALIRPDGSSVAADASDAQLQSFRYMTIATIKSPEPGAWRLLLTGVGKYAVTAHVKPGNAGTAPAFQDFDFVQRGGRPGHEGWFPIRRELRKGETIECSAEVAGRVSAVAFTFVTRDDRPIATAPLQAEGDDGEYFGRCVIPNVPFRVAVSGRDETGRPFRRVESGLNSPK